jgi:hypothetical protein
MWWAAVIGPKRCAYESGTPSLVRGVMWSDSHRRDPSEGPLLVIPIRLELTDLLRHYGGLIGN